MYKLLVTLHVLSAVLLIGPFALGAFAGRRAIRQQDADGTRVAARWMARAGAGSLVVALLGFAALPFSKRFDFGTPWVIISITVYVITMGVATGYTVPALRKAAKLLEEDALPRLPGTGGAQEPTIAASASDLEHRGKLDAVSGRIAGSGAIVLLGIVVIVVLMTWRPFGA
jgi:Predicted integral membrane protein (DUF2269)